MSNLTLDLTLLVQVLLGTFTTIVALVATLLLPHLSGRSLEAQRPDEIEAALIAYVGTTLHLRKADGKIVKVPLDRMSHDDQAVLQKHLAAGLPQMAP